MELQCTAVNTLMILRETNTDMYSVQDLQRKIHDEVFAQLPSHPDTVHVTIPRGNLKGQLTASYQCVSSEASEYLQE